MYAKQKTALVFPDMHVLWAFAQTINRYSIKILHDDRCVLFCDCSEDDVRRAIIHFGATPAGASDSINHPYYLPLSAVKTGAADGRKDDR